MYRIVFGVVTLEQHQQRLASSPQDYRPAACPHCGLAGLWPHGHYERKADREGRLNPIEIPRYFCGVGCGRTCSRLPQCIAPRRWYGWVMQQRVLGLLLSGASLRRCSDEASLDRHTVRRWWTWLQARGDTFTFLLKSRFPQWGRCVDWKAFWSTCLTHLPLSEAMTWLDRDGVRVP